MGRSLLLVLAFFAASNLLFGQAEVPKVETGWKRTGGIGYDLTGLGIVNPRVGAGLNRFGIGGLGTFAADKKVGKWYWENNAALQLGVIRLGGRAQPFTKGIDNLRVMSKAGRAISANGKWNATALVIGQTSILKTYEGNFLEGGYNPDGSIRKLFSKFLSPAQLQFHPGIEWKPDEHFSLLISPVGLVLTYVGDEVIAGTYVHGNELGKNNRLQVVPSLQAGYKNKYFNDRVTWTSALNLTTDYRNKPFSITALNFWQNNVSIALFKGLSLDLFGEAAYDHWKLVQKDTDNDGKLNIGTINAPTVKNGLPSNTGPDKLGFGTQWTGSFLLKYNKIF